MIPLSGCPPRRGRAPRVRLVLASVLSLGPAFAQTAPAPEIPASRALSLFHASEQEYRAGDYRGAAAHLREAYALEPRPILLYNLALACENAGEVAAAIQAYEQYDAAGPSEDHAAVSRRLSILRRQLEEREALKRRYLATEQALEQSQAAERTRAVGEQRRREITPPLVVLGVGVLGLAAGTVLAVVAHSRDESAQSAPMQNTAATDLDSARSFATAANTTFLAAGAVALAGAGWTLARLLTFKPDSLPEPRASASASPTPTVGLRVP